MERQKGSGRPRTGTTRENEEAVEEMICSQKNHSGTHVPPKDIAEGLSISQSFVRRMIKRKPMKQFKRIKTPYINSATLKRRAECAGYLLEKLETNPLMIERVVFQDESYFLLQISINSQNDRAYFKGQKKDVPDKNLSHQSNRQSVKVMVSAELTWFEVTKPLFVNKKGLKVNAENYRKHLKR